MDDCIGSELLKNSKELILLDGNVNFAEVNGLSCDLFPLGDPLFDGLDGADTWVSILLVDLSSVKVVKNQDLISHIGES